MESIDNYHFSTWSATQHADPGHYYEPSTIEQIQQLVRMASENQMIVRVVGSGHSPNDSAISRDMMISLKKMNQVLVVDREKCVVKVQAGVQLSTMHETLDKLGMAMPNLGSISEQTIAGAICTGTHGKYQFSKWFSELMVAKELESVTA